MAKTHFFDGILLLPTRESRKDSARGISWDLTSLQAHKAWSDPTASCTGTTRDPVGARAAPRAVSCQKRDLKSCDPDSAGGSGLGGLAYVVPPARGEASGWAGPVRSAASASKQQPVTRIATQ
jgi:hypothetical protein